MMPALRQARVLIACLYFRRFTGSEVNCLELADVFAAWGADVTIAAVDVASPAMDAARARGHRVARIRELSGEFDLAWTHQAMTYWALREAGIVAHRFVHSCLSPYEPRETPPITRGGLNLLLANSEETEARLVKGLGLPQACVEVLRNSAPEVFFTHPVREAFPEEGPRRIGIVSNHVPAELTELVASPQGARFGFEVIGFGGREELVSPSLLAEFDAVVSIGKTVQYCLALGIPVFVYDRFGGPGWITTENVATAEALNFSGRCTPRKATPVQLAESLAAGYAAACASRMPLRERAVERYRLVTNVAQVVDSLAGRHAQPFEIEPSLRLIAAHQEMAAALQTEIDSLHATGRAREENRLLAWRMVKDLQQAVASKEALVADMRAASERLTAELALASERFAAEFTVANERSEELQRQMASLRERFQAELGVLNDRNQELARQAEAAREWAERLATELRSVYASRSWKITAPIRLASRSARSLVREPRRSLVRASQACWRALPITQATKDGMKRRFFEPLAPMIGHTGLYQRWRQYEQTRQLYANMPALPPPAAAEGRAPDGAALATPALSAPASQYVEILEAAPVADPAVTLVAFYLPQFHPIPENDAWWGRGFTEWTNVTKAEPQFVGHYQPHLPGELGYYDLRVPAVQERQVELARLYGIGAFCFYFYWFGGKRLLELPILQYLENKSLDLPFCLCWANENWSRRWDGRDREILIGQCHSAEDDLAFIEYVSQYLRDPRYLRVDGRPVLLVYRPSLLPDVRATVRRWREWCRANGVGEIFLAYTMSFESVDPRSYDFDAAIEFPPNNSAPPAVTDQVQLVNPEFSGVVYDWRVFVERSRAYQAPTHPLFRGVTPSWDNVARLNGRGTIFYGSSPEGYREWLANACVDTMRRVPDRSSRLVFVNAWNEWAEGAHLEPDRKYGYAYLQATREALEMAAKVQANKRIVLVSHDAHPHGAQYLALHLARVLAEDFGALLDIVVLGEGPLKAEYARHGTVHDLAGVDPEGPVAQALASRLFAAGARAALCNTTVSGLFLSTLKRTGLRCVSLIHELPGVIERYGLQTHVQRIADQADVVVFPASQVQRGFQHFLGKPLASARIRPQGLYKRNALADTDRQSAARAALRAKLGLPAGARVVLGVGYADHRKGIDLFIDAGARVMRDDPLAVFVWLGHHDLAIWEAMKHRVRETGFADRFLFPGRDPETDVYYAGADVFALTSREDPFPSVVLESLEVAVPVVAFAGTGGCCELLEAGTGCTVPAFDVDAFAQAVAGLLREPEQARTLGREGARRVRDDFSFRHYVFDLADWLGMGIRRVSAIVPNYNYAAYLEERLRSIDRQAYPVFELIVLDDASTDDSLRKAREILPTLRVDARLVPNERNSGSVFRQWRKGVGLARGEFVWIAEADDSCEPEFLSQTVEAMEDDSVVMSYSQSTQMDGEGRIMCPHYLDYVADISPERWTKPYRVTGAAEIRDALAIKNTVPNVSAVVFRRDVIQEVLDRHGADIESYRVAGDWVTYLRVLEHGDIVYVPASLNHHRRHQKSVTLGAFNLEQLREIMSVQAMVMQDHRPSRETREKAYRYAVRLYEQFGLSSQAAPSPLHHTSLRSLALALASPAAAREVLAAEPALRTGSSD